MLLHLGDDRLRDRSLVQGSRSLAGEPAQHVGESRIAQRAAGRQRPTVRGVEIGACIFLPAQQRFLGEQGVQSLADRKAFLGEADGRREEFGPRQSPMLGVRHFEHAHGTRNADRPAASDCPLKAHRLAVGLEE